MAGTASVGGGIGGGSLIYDGSPGELNDVTVAFSGDTYTVTESGPGVQIFFDPSSCSGDTATIMCEAAEFMSRLGDGDDKLSFLSVPQLQAIPDLADGGPGDDELSGSDGREVLFGGPGTDNLTGGAGNDNLLGGAGSDVLAGGPGDDAFEDIGAPLEGIPGVDSVSGGEGNDRLDQGSSDFAIAQAFSGGPGARDLADYPERTRPLTVTLDGRGGDGQAGEGDNIGADVEDVVGGERGDRLIGSASANALDGGPGEDSLAGGGGNDTLAGGSGEPGDDTLDGGAGDDTISGGPDDDTLDGADGDDALDGGTGDDRLEGQSGSDTQSGGPGRDVVTGGPGNDLLHGGESGLGADDGDTLRGGEGADTLLGDGGEDVLDGGPGPDVLSGSAGIDRAEYGPRLERVTVSLDGRPNDGARGERDNVSADVEDARGGLLGDDLLGDSVSNTLDGDAGEDYLDGAGGADQLLGGGRGDVLRARDGRADRIVCGEGPDFVVADTGDAVEADCEIVDRGRSRPSVATRAVVRPTSGNGRMSPTGIRRLVPLRDGVGLPFGSRLDATSGSVNVRTAREGGRVQRARLSGGLFQILQASGRRPVTDLVLRGGDFRPCRAAAGGRRAVSAATRRIRRLRGRGRGRFRTRGRYSAATVRGTTWIVEDRCDGTLTRVLSGSAVVRDFRRRRRVVVRPGRPYLARARATARR